jgi:ParB family chromosome partitioning protein
MTTAAEKVAAGEAAAEVLATDKTAEKAEKQPDKRRALGRGLESLLPSRENRAAWSGGPKVVPASPPMTNVSVANLPVANVPAAAAEVKKDTSAAQAPPQGGVVGDIQAQAAGGSREAVVQIRLDLIDANPYQTRVEFDKEALTDLAESIKANGVVQPIVVRPGTEGRYVLVLGERRCRASKAAGMATVPGIVRRISELQAAEMTVIENLQRQDLNCMEQATAFSKLSKNFNLTQAQIGERVGLSRESVANYMRLLRLPDTVMDYLRNGVLGFSEARELLKLEEDDLIEEVAKQVVEQRLSFLQLMDMVERLTMKKYLREDPVETRGARWVDPNVRAAQQELQRVLGLKVKISDRKGKGKIVIEYATVDDYDRVVGMLRGK